MQTPRGEMTEPLGMSANWLWLGTDSLGRYNRCEAGVPKGDFMRLHENEKLFDGLYPSRSIVRLVLLQTEPVLTEVRI